jgi:hypothetical protein
MKKGRKRCTGYFAFRRLPKWAKVLEAAKIEKVK